MQAWHTKSVDETMQLQNTAAEGLSQAEAKKRLEEHGYNELEQKQGKTVLQLFLEQLKDFMIIVLLAAAAISAALGEVIDAVVILVIVLLNAVIGVAQEKKAENSLEALKKMSAPSAKVLRDGEVESVPSREIVPGDIVVLEAGDMVPADLRLIECVNLKIQESALTGESLAVDKDALLDLKEDTALGDRLNMAFSGSVVTYGRGKGVVVETGMQTQVGAIADMLSAQGERMTPLQQKLEKLGKTLAIVAMAVCALIFGVGLLYGKEPFHMFMTAVSLAVAAIPEGLPAVATIVLALGVQRMVKRNAIVRTLHSVETLGSASVICSDKTGTLTQNKMTVTHVYCDGRLAPVGEWDTQSETYEKLVQDCALCNDAHYRQKDGAVTAIGDPTEIALLDFALQARGEIKIERVAELPFDSDRKLMTTVHSINGKLVAFVKGGVDILLKRCDNMMLNGEIAALNVDAINDANEEMARNALRVLGMAYREMDELPEDLTTLESHLTYVGMTGMIDPPRDEARDAVQKCREAGIRTIMITGDHLTTAQAIAKSLGILREGDIAITGNDLDDMSDEEFNEKFERISVYARISPEHKVRIVKAWQEKGNIVAMTGDGVNDAPALKNADIGAAMGIVGTEVAKEAADIVLTDDNFATVVSAVEEGRRVYDNILKAIQFLLSCNVGEILVLFLATLLNWESPLLPVHILWVNLVTDSLPALGLGVDPAASDIMQRPVHKTKGVFTGGMVWRICYQGVMVAAITLIAFCIGQADSVAAGQTMAFCVLAFSQLVHCFNIRSIHYSLFARKSIGSNKMLLGAVLLAGLLMVLVLAIPALSQIFSVVALTGTQWLWVGILSITPFVVVELMKLLHLNEIHHG